MSSSTRAVVKSMSDRIIRAASVRQVRAWVPQSLASGSATQVRSMAASGGARNVNTAADADDAINAFTPEQEAQIRQALEEAHARGLEAGMQQGFEQGFAQGLSQAEAATASAQAHQSEMQADALTQALQSALSDVVELNEQVQQQLPEWVAQMALAVARQVVGEAALKNPADISRRIHAAVENLADNLRSQMQLIMHPDTRKQLASVKSGSTDALLAQVREDDSLAPGGFILRTSHGDENHTLENRWKRTVETFSSNAGHQRWS